jgi:hypothetical protein
MKRPGKMVKSWITWTDKKRELRMQDKPLVEVSIKLFSITATNVPLTN